MLHRIAQFAKQKITMSIHNFLSNPVDVLKQAINEMGSDEYIVKTHFLPSYFSVYAGCASADFDLFILFLSIFKRKVSSRSRSSSELIMNATVFSY